jgi:hypothetical protein
MGLTPEEIELRLELLTIQLKELAKIVQEIDDKAQRLLDRNV